MSADLKVTRIDSPLARGETPTSAPRSDISSPAEPLTRSAQARQPPTGLPERRFSSAHPPPLEEPLALVSHRVPESLKINLGRFTRELRERRGRGVPDSQKTLPEQEVLALALWLLGDPRDAEDLKRVAAAHNEYRASQLAAAAEALRPPV